MSAQDTCCNAGQLQDSVSHFWTCQTGSEGREMKRLSDRETIIRHPAVGCSHQVNTSTAVFTPLISYSHLHLLIYYLAIFNCKVFHHMPSHKLSKTRSWTKVHMQAAGIHILAGMYLESVGCVLRCSQCKWRLFYFAPVAHPAQVSPIVDKRQESVTQCSRCLHEPLTELLSRLPPKLLSPISLGKRKRSSGSP